MDGADVLHDLKIHQQNLTREDEEHNVLCVRAEQGMAKIV
jgi:hypothetical protein